MKSTSDIALLFFARSPYRDKKRRAFASNKLHMEVVSHLHLKTYKQLRDSGLPVIVSNEHTQRSHSLAVNLSRAISEVFQKGFEKVIVVGNDCPEMNQLTLEKAITNLHEGKNVLGPDMEGGNYLIGIHKSGFCEKAFENALSISSQVHERLYAFLQKSDEPIVVLDQKHDINSLAALLKYIKSSAKLSATTMLLRKAYYSFIHFAKLETHYLLRSCDAIFSFAYFRRGPPICI